MRTLRRVVALVVLVGAGCTGDPTGLPGSLVVRVVTTGTDLDQAYAVRMGSSAYPIVGDTQVMTIPRAGPGRVRVALEQVASNCTVNGGTTRTALVPRKGQVELRFDVACTATSAVIGVRASITGGLPDSVVTARVGVAAMRDVPWGATLWTEGLPAGDHTVTLAGVAANCTVVGTNSQSVSVTTGGTARDTTIVTFEVACVPDRKSTRLNSSHLVSP